jgi:hypothetical protein
MQLKDLVVPPEPLLTHPFARDLSSEKQFELATGTIVKAVKERTDAPVTPPDRSGTLSRAITDWAWRLLRYR